VDPRLTNDRRAAAVEGDARAKENAMDSMNLRKKLEALDGLDGLVLEVRDALAKLPSCRATVSHLDIAAAALRDAANTLSPVVTLAEAPSIAWRRVSDFEMRAEVGPVVLCSILDEGRVYGEVRFPGRQPVREHAEGAFGEYPTLADGCRTAEELLAAEGA
jgi:hypothetical protein